MFGIKKKAKKRTVLFVHNDELFLQSLERNLFYTPYNKLFAKTCEEALEITQQEEVHVIVADMCLSKMTGLGLFRAVRKECPNVIGIILTGYEDDELLNAVEQGEILTFVSKPWEFGLVDLKSLVRRAIDSCGKCTCERLGITSNEEKPQIPKEPQQKSPKENQETSSECYQETLLKESDKASAKIESESPGDGSNSHKWNNKIEVQRFCSGKSDLEIVEKKTVLFVDDDEVILRSLERRLSDESYNKLFIKSSKEAFEILKQQKVHVIVTDMCMPEMTGLELLRAAKKENPNIVGIVLTGYELDAELQKAVDHGEVFTLLAKPLWKFGGKFETLIHRALDSTNLKNCHVVE